MYPHIRGHTCGTKKQEGGDENEQMPRSNISTEERKDTFLQHELHVFKMYKKEKKQNIAVKKKMKGKSY